MCLLVPLQCIMCRSCIETIFRSSCVNPLPCRFQLFIINIYSCSLFQTVAAVTR